LVNHVTNDKGVSVIAVGAPGSLARVKVEYPRLIERLNALYNGEAKLDVAIEEIRSKGITSELETNSLIEASHYGERAKTRGWM
jgi:hypothetical protein